MAIISRWKSLGLVGLVSSLALVGLYQIKETHERKTRKLVERADKPKFTFDDIYSSNFRYKSVSVRWVSGHEYIYMDDENNVKKKNVETDDETSIMAGSVYKNNNAASYKVSADEKYVALLTEYKKGWRHSYNGTYLIYDVEANKLQDDFKTPPHTQYFAWAPKGNALTFVNGFDIFYRSSVDNATVQVTDNGRANYVYNGIPDWVYEEEMISSNNVMYFSPDGKYLAFAQFNDTNCKHINFERYDGKRYPEMLDVSYPKAGTPQSTNKVFVYNTVTADVLEVEPPSQFTDVDYLFNRVTWASNDQAAVSWCNREQNKSELRMMFIDATYFNASYYVESPIFKLASDTGWVYQRRPYWIPVFGESPNAFYTVKPNRGYQHLYKITFGQEGPTTVTEQQEVTNGEYTVTSESAAYPAVEIYNKETDSIFFSSTKESPQHRHIYRAFGNPVQVECMTCKYAQQYAGRCDYISTQFSTDGSYVIVRCGGDGPPMYIQAKINHTASDPDKVFVNEKVLEDNQDLVDKVESTDMSTKEYGLFPSSSNYNFAYQIWKPPNFDETKKYPLLIDVYAGPGYQRVYASWSRGWSSRFLPSSLDVVVASVDGRGSNFYGDEFMHEVYKKLGQYEPLDQLEFAKFMSKKSWIDSSRIAAWGWSYGGYATSHILGNDAEGIMKCGFAVAPLTDWKFYDTIYTERYMGLPDGNEEGYEKAAVMPLAKNFKQSAYYLIHGTADDNVHFQNAARIEKELVANDIDFNDFFYADQDHSINTGNAGRHVYKVLTRQVCQCFQLEVPDGVW